MDRLWALRSAFSIGRWSLPDRRQDALPRSDAAQSSRRSQSSDGESPKGTLPRSLKETTQRSGSVEPKEDEREAVIRRESPPTCGNSRGGERIPSTPLTRHFVSEIAHQLPTCPLKSGETANRPPPPVLSNPPVLPPVTATREAKKVEAAPRVASRLAAGDRKSSRRQPVMWPQSRLRSRSARSVSLST